MKSKLISCFLLILVIFHSAGFYLSIELNRFMVKQEMSSRIASAKNLKLEILVFNDHSTSFSLIGKKELKYQGKMYDVVFQTKHQNSTVFYCIHDVKEDGINAGIAKTMKERTRHLLIPVFENIAILADHEILSRDPGEVFSFLPCLQRMSSAIRIIPETPPKAC